MLAIFNRFQSVNEDTQAQTRSVKLRFVNLSVSVCARVNAVLVCTFSLYMYVCVEQQRRYIIASFGDDDDDVDEKLASKSKQHKIDLEFVRKFCPINLKVYKCLLTTIN